MSKKSLKLTIGEQIDRHRQGRSQKWIVSKMVEKGIKITEVKLSNKKNGYELFTEDELAALSEILGVSLEK
jgi:hypothetical protein